MSVPENVVAAHRAFDALDHFRRHITDLDDPAVHSFDIVADGNHFPMVTRFIYVGTGGDVELSLVGDEGAFRTFRNVPSGWHLPYRCAACGPGTTAADLIGLV